MHNILCKLISASDNDLGIAWSAEAAVTTLSNHILNYVSLYRKVLQKHTDMKSVCSSPTANHLTSFPVTAVTAALGSGKARPAGQTQTPQATRHPGPQAHPGRGTLPSLGTAPAQGESAQRTSPGHLPPTLARGPDCPDSRQEGCPLPIVPSPSLMLETPVPRPDFHGMHNSENPNSRLWSPRPFHVPRRAWLAVLPSPLTQQLGSAPSPQAGELSLDSHTHTPGMACPTAGGGGPVAATWGAWCRWPEGQKRPAPGTAAGNREPEGQGSPSCSEGQPRRGGLILPCSPLPLLRSQGHHSPFIFLKAFFFFFY